MSLSQQFVPISKEEKLVKSQKSDRLEGYALGTLSSTRSSPNNEFVKPSENNPAQCRVVRHNCRKLIRQPSTQKFQVRIR